MLQSSSGGAAHSHRDAHGLLVATADLGVESFSHLLAVVTRHLAFSQSGYPRELANGSLTTSLDLAASQWLGQHSEALVSEFRGELARQAAEFCSGAATSAPVRTSGTLESLTFDETEVLVTIRSLAQWIENLSHEEFYLFNHRLGYLCGEFALPPARNPFSPGRVLESVDTAARRLAGYEELRAIIVRLLKRGGLEAAVSVYGVLNQFLLDHGVLPRFRPKIRRDVHEEDARLRTIGPITEEVERFRGELAAFATAARRRIDPSYRSPEELARAAEEAERARVEADRVAVPPAAPADAAGEPVALRREEAAERAQVVAMPRTDWRAIAAMRPAAPAAKTRRRVAESVLDAIRASAVAARIGRFGAATLQITNFAFDEVLVARQLATPIRLMLSRLQVAFYKAALLDVTVLSQRPHPVRGLVNRMSEAGIAWSPELGENDSLYQIMSGIVERLQEPARDEVELFGRELERFDAFLEAETRDAKQAAIERARALYEGERNRVAYATAVTEVDRCLQDEIFPPLPDFAERFVRDTWVHTLRDAYVREGKEGQAWQANVEFLHELTWSLKPKPTESERRILLRMLPELVTRIEASVVQARADRGLREFLSELMQAHLYLVRKGVLPRHLRGGVAPGTARERLDYLKVLEKLDPNLARRPPPPTLLPGSWTEFGSGSATRFRKRLVWVSPLSHRALFTNRRGEGELVLTPAEVQQKLAAGELAALRVAPLFDASLASAKLRIGAKMPPPAGANDD
jgi:hypothetical protein